MAWSSGMHGLSAAAAAMASHHAAASSLAQLDSVMLFGFISAFATGVSYLYRRNSRAAMLTFAASLAATGVYGFIEGARPLGILEIAWAIDATRRGLRAKSLHPKRRPQRSLFVPDLESRQARYREIFGSN
jgi:hypothetical protein